MLVPKPKKAFQSPGVQIFGLIVVVRRCSCCLHPRSAMQLPSAARMRLRIRDPTEDPALGLDHSQAHLVKLGEVRAAAVAGDDAAVAAVVRFAHRGVDADLGRHAADDQVLDAAVAAGSRADRWRRTRPCPACRSPARRRIGIELRDDVVARARRGSGCAPSGPGSPMRLLGAPRSTLARRRVGQVGAMALARVDDQHARLARRRRAAPPIGLDGRRSSDTSLPSFSPKPPGSRKSRCMSMITIAVRFGSIESASGSASIVMYAMSMFPSWIR